MMFDLSVGLDEFEYWCYCACLELLIALNKNSLTLLKSNVHVLKLGISVADKM